MDRSVDFNEKDRSRAVVNVSSVQDLMSLTDKPHDLRVLQHAGALAVRLTAVSGNHKCCATVCVDFEAGESFDCFRCADHRYC